jgi:hypothetical protein
MPAIMTEFGGAGARADFHSPQSAVSFVLYAPECQVDPGLSYARLLGHLVLEMLLCESSHDQ